MIKPTLLSALFSSSLLFSAASTAETCQGPAPCGWEPEEVSTPAADQLCLGGAVKCVPVVYDTDTDPLTDGAWRAKAYSVVGGYPIMGIAGPCLKGQEFPAIFGEAKDALSVQIRQDARVMRFLR